MPSARALPLGAPDRADLGIGEGDPGHRPVVGRHHLAAEDVPDHDVRLVHRDVGEASLPGHVAHRPRPLDALDPHVVVDRQRPCRRVQAHRRDVQLLEVHPPPGGDQQLVGRDRLALGGHDGEPPSVVPDRLDLDRGPHTDALGAEHVGKQCGCLGLLGADQVGRRLERP